MRSKKTLLIIGAGREQIQAYKLAKEMGLIVVGTDINCNAPAFKYSDYQIIASTRDANSTLDAVISFNNRHRIDGVMTIANDVPYTVALVASNLGLKGIPVESAKYFMNKIEMKKCFKRENIKTPDFISISNKKNFLSKIKDFSFPLIIKPSDGRGSRGVLYLDKHIDIDWAYEHSFASCENNQLILEKFIEGPQLSVEGLFVEGKYFAVAFADRNYSNLNKTKPYIVEDGGQIPSKFEDELLDQIEKLIQDGAESLGISWGSVKADIVIGSDGPEIIELAGRLSGNYLATHHIPMAYGIDIVGSLINMSIDKKVNIEELKPKYKNFLGVRYFFPNKGIIKSITGTKEVRSKKHCRMLDIFVREGDAQKIIDSHVSRAGTVICEGDDYQSAKFRAEQAVSKIKFLVD